MGKINFDALPDNNEMSLPDIGHYFGTIKKAEMKANKTNPSKPDYLNMQIVLTKQDGRGAGTMFVKLFDSDSGLLQYQLKRFIAALELPIKGAFELKDLTKMVINKKLIIAVTHDVPTDPKYQPQAVPNIRDNSIFYSIKQASEVFEGTSATDIEPEDTDDGPVGPINGADADDDDIDI